MNKAIAILLVITLHQPALSQSDEAQQLLLDIEKLTQFKTILQQMKDAYQILHSGYTAIKNISEGNFNLHKAFLDGLLQVSPAVKGYKRIADILNYQLQVVKEGKSVLNRFKNSSAFTGSELTYIGNVYSNLAQQSLNNLDELTMVITAGKLRMSDDERLQAIERIFDNIHDQYSFLREFASQTMVLMLQRESELSQIELSRRIAGQ